MGVSLTETHGLVFRSNRLMWLYLLKAEMFSFSSGTDGRVFFGRDTRCVFRCDLGMS